MKKRLSFILCMLVAAFSLSACGTDNQAEYDAQTLEQAAEVLIEYCATADEQTVSQWQSMSDFQLEYQLMQSGLPYTPDGFLGALEAWPAAIEECGAYMGHGDFEVTADGDEISVTTTGEFEERNAEILVTFDANSRLDSLSISAEYGVGEILKKSGMNTILGMGTVFIVLIFISIVISLLKYIPALGAAFQKKKEKSATSGAADTTDTWAQENAKLADDSEIIAVITAAIAAAEAEEAGSSDGFVVRSIRRRPSNKWKA